MKAFIRIAAAVASLLGAAALSPAHAAEAYPGKPIRLVVPFAPGSGSDSIARNLVDRVGRATGWTFIVDNRAGANGLIGAQEAKRSPKDGLTLFYGGNSTHGANSALYKVLPYDPVADFDPVVRVAVFPLVLMPKPQLGVQSVADLVKLAKARPGDLTFGSGSAGPVVAGETFKFDAGIDIRNVPYKASPQALIDLVGNNVDMLFLDTVASLPMIRNKTLQPLALTSARPVACLPGVPTMQSLGFKGYEVLNWSAIFAPHGVPADVQDALYKAFAAVVGSQEWSAYVADLGGDSDPQSREETSAFIKKEIASYKVNMARAGIAPE